MEEELLALTSRRRIFEHVSRNPGTYLREMEPALGMSVGDLQYHLGQLEKGGLLFTHDDGKRKGYFVTSEVQFFDRQLISIMRMRTPRRIVMFLLTHPDSGFSSILAEFNFTKGALSFHMKRLLRAGVVEKGRSERENIYRVREPERVSNLLVTYRASIADEVLDNMIDVLARI